MNNGMKIKYNGVQHQVTQDVSAYKDYAKQQRDLQQTGGGNRFRSFAIIPDIVAVDILKNHGINLHAAEFFTNPEDVAKLKRIIKTEYPDLLTSNVRATRG